MKAKDFIIIGGAVGLFLLWQKNKNKKASTSSVEENGATTSGGQAVFTGGGTSPMGTSQVNTFPTPTSNQPQQIYGLGLPTGMDLPVLTAGTGVPTEVAIQQGGVVTAPPSAPPPPTPPPTTPAPTTPATAIVQAPSLSLSTEEALTTGGVRPISVRNSSLITDI
jgi:hypothetical protein